MSEIKAHPWYNGPTASHEEVKAEFELRKKKVDHELKKQEMLAQRKKEIEMKKRTANPAFTGIKPSFRSHGVEDAGIEGTIAGNDSFNNIIQSFNNIQKDDLKLRRQDATIAHLNTSIYVSSHYSVLEPVELFKAALCAAHKHSKNVKANTEKLSVRTLFVDPLDEIYCPIEHLSGWNQDEDSRERRRRLSSRVYQNWRTFP